MHLRDKEPHINITSREYHDGTVDARTFEGGAGTRRCSETRTAHRTNDIGRIPCDGWPTTVADDRGRHGARAPRKGGGYFSAEDARQAGRGLMSELVAAMLLSFDAWIWGTVWVAVLRLA